MRLMLVLATAAVCAWSQAPTFTVETLLKIRRISEPQISPDGRTVAFTLETPDLESNTRPRQIWTVPVEGGAPQRITSEGTRNMRPRWTPDGRIVYASNRGGSTQLWAMNADGTGAKQITNLSTEAADAIVTPDGKHIVFTSEVYPACGADDECNRKKLDAENRNPVKARVYTNLLYRHWSSWQSERRKHVFVVPIGGGKAWDLTPGSLDVPTFSLGGPDDIAVSPDAKEIAYVANTEPNQALSTNTDIFVVPLAGGDAKRVSTSPGADRSPAYSADGKYIAFRSQLRAGYESDKWRLATIERATGKVSLLTEALDQPVESFAWSPNSASLFFVTEDRGRGPLHTMPVGGGGTRVIISGNQHVDDVQFSADGKTMIYTAQTASKPVEIFRAASAGGAAVAITTVNSDLLSQYRLPAAEEFKVAASDGAPVWSFLIKPPNFDPKKKYPVLMLIHGGPQSAWGESFHYRWNPHVFAGAGYVVVMPNPRGSIGYGQKFTDDINQDWGGKPFEDLMDVADYVASLPYVDKDRMAAGGGSYGGYMTNWILGHTDRFKALVSHAGTFDLASSNLETEELWFPLWEFRAMPWQNPELYTRMSPSTYAKEFKSPTLILHGELDYRVPSGQALQLFTALKLQNVPSKMVLFPDEGHWILKPQNSVLWYRSFLDWVNEWTLKP